MRTYKLKVAMPFTDKYDEERKYKKNEIIDVTEERALELFSSDYHLVKYVSYEDNNSEILEENKSLKKEIELLNSKIVELEASTKKEKVVDNANKIEKNNNKNEEK